VSLAVLCILTAYALSCKAAAEKRLLLVIIGFSKNRPQVNNNSDLVKLFQHPIVEKRICKIHTILSRL
jgi:hypothetical protein